MLPVVTLINIKGCLSPVSSAQYLQRAQRSPTSRNTRQEISKYKMAAKFDSSTDTRDTSSSESSSSDVSSSSDSEYESEKERKRIRLKRTGTSPSESLSSSSSDCLRGFLDSQG